MHRRPERFELPVALTRQARFIFKLVIHKEIQLLSLRLRLGTVPFMLLWVGLVQSDDGGGDVGRLLDWHARTARVTVTTCALRSVRSVLGIPSVAASGTLVLVTDWQTDGQTDREIDGLTVVFFRCGRRRSH